ncbi:MAG: phosphatase PAP2 family protein [Candidatus Zixiibacteriota bacterium]
MTQKTRIKKLFTPIDFVFIGWFILAFILIAIAPNPVEYNYLLLLYHILIIACMISFFLYCRNRLKYSRLLLLFRFAYPPFFFTLQFEEIYLTNRIFFKDLLDPWFISLEEKIFGLQPSMVLWHKMPWDWFSEFMHFAYFMFYPLFAFVVIEPFIKKRYSLFAKIVFIITFSFSLCYTIYMILPVAGPRIAIPESNNIPHNGFIFAAIMRYIYSKAAIVGAAFPSSHCAMAVVNMLIVHKYIKWAKVLITIITIALIFSTFYLRYHYVIDSIAGVIFGVFCFYFSEWLLRKLRKKNFLWITDII